MGRFLIFLKRKAPDAMPRLDRQSSRSAGAKGVDVRSITQCGITHREGIGETNPHCVI